MQGQLLALMAQYTVQGQEQMTGGAEGAGDGGEAGATMGTVRLPCLNLLFDGTNLQPVDLSDCVQGVGCMCAD